MNGKKALTLVEMVAVITIIGLLATVGVPYYFRSVDKAKEAALLSDLKAIRKAIDSYYSDMFKYPQMLDDLVKKKYLRNIPKDPFTGERDWVTVPSDDGKNDIYDIHSNSTKRSSNGEYYSEW